MRTDTMKAATKSSSMPPLTVIKEIYERLDIPAFTNAEEYISAQINKSKKYLPFSTTSPKKN